MKSINIALDAAGVSFEKTTNFVCNNKLKSHMCSEKIKPGFFQLLIFELITLYYPLRAGLHERD